MADLDSISSTTFLIAASSRTSNSTISIWQREKSQKSALAHTRDKVQSRLPTGNFSSSAALISFAARFRSRTAAKTVCPKRAKPRAVPSPNPELQPVISAVGILRLLFFVKVKDAEAGTPYVTGSVASVLDGLPARMLPTRETIHRKHETNRNRMSKELSVKELNDIHAIRDLLDRYGSYVDEKDWGGFRTLFTDPLDTDFSGMDSRFPPNTITLDEQLASTSSVIGQFAATQHMITNAQVFLEQGGDRATCRATMRAEHW